MKLTPNSKTLKAFFLVIFVLNISIVFSQKYSLTNTPKWITNVDYIASTTPEEGSGFRYLLVDFQDNIVKKTSYSHYAIKILNTEGIQSMSDIDITFDPSYQKLLIHKAQIIRNGKVLNKLNDSKIHTIQKETNSERSIYDGSLTTIINLKDVRESDIIEYAYSIVGFNPINKGNYGRTFYQKFTLPVNRVYNKVISKGITSLKFKYFDEGEKPAISKKNNEIEYTWDFNAEDFETYDSNSPAWFSSQRRVSISTFNSWKNVVDWALPIFEYNESDLKNIQLNLDKNISTEDQILATIRFVQDEIRYLGFENGISSYKPHSPKKVYNQRYGDCKDKSLLLVALLRKLDIESYPLLVDTTEGTLLTKILPSNHAFDHCVVYFKHKDTDYFIDPTISNQGGDINNISFPNYEYGLLIKPNEKELINIPYKVIPKLTINETITIDSIGSAVKLNIRSNYSGSKADYMRSYFGSYSKESIHKDYLNFYSRLYQNIELLSDVFVAEDYRNTDNEIIIEENYLIDKFWQDSDDGVSVYFETYPLVIESLLDYSNSAKRTMPYYLGEPHNFKQVTVIDLFEEWPVEDSFTTIKGDSFSYENIIKGFGSRIEISHEYVLTDSYISSDKTEEFLEKQDEVMENFSYFLSYNKSLEGYRLSWIAIFLLIVTISIGVYFFIEIYKYYNPSPKENAEGLTIGGWLVLPGIGLVLTPIILLFQLFSEDYFNQNTWIGILNSGFENPYELLALVGFEFIYNIFFITFSIFLIILYFNRRTSLPMLISILYVLNFLIPLIDIIASNIILPKHLIEASSIGFTKDIARNFFSACIWIPYFHMSNRVKNTFIHTYKNDQ